MPAQDPCPLPAGLPVQPHLQAPPGGMRRPCRRTARRGAAAPGERWGVILLGLAHRGLGTAKGGGLTQREAAAVLAASLREDDVVSCRNGTEFLIPVRVTCGDSLLKIADRLCQAALVLPEVQLGECRGPVRAAAGCAMVAPGEEQLAPAVGRAGAALQDACARGAGPVLAAPAKAGADCMS